MASHADKFRPHTPNVSRNPGREAIRRNDERHYINHRPPFAVHYFPQKEPEEVWLHIWEHDLIVYGYKLAPLYDKLKANARDVELAESAGPYDPAADGTYILKIEYVMDS
jgi:hypothetical protein